MEISAKNGYGLEQLFKLIQFDLFADIEDDNGEKKRKKKKLKKRKKVVMKNANCAVIKFTD